MSRWEWRLIEPVGDLLTRVHPLLVGPRAPLLTDLYFVAARSPHGVKIRAERLEVKRRLQCADDGLELWTPSVTEDLPVAWESFAEACAALRIRPPGVRLARVSREAFLVHVRAMRAVVGEVSVTKSRAPLECGGCRGEYVELAIGDARWESIALESEDPDEVRRAVALLGSSVGQNQSYPSALQRFAGFTPEMPLLGAREAV